MKNLIFAVLLLASFSANAASHPLYDGKYFDAMVPEQSSDFFDSWISCSASSYSCTGVSYGFRGPIIDGELMGIRDMWAYHNKIFSTKDVYVTFTWDIQNVLPGSFKATIIGDSISGIVLDFSSLSGSYSFLLKAFEQITFGVNVDNGLEDSYFKYEINGTPVSEVPIPATFLLLAPFGTLLIARKYKLSK